MKPTLWILLLLAGSILIGCDFTGRQSRASPTSSSASSDSASRAPRNAATVIHVLVALCDNVNQGIVPVAPGLGNGDDPRSNLYWGAAFGVRTFFTKNRDWQPVSVQGEIANPQVILERIVFKRRDREVFLVADAYRGSEIRRATQDFLEAAAGSPGETVNVAYDGKSAKLHLSGSAALIAYVGHDGLMDFRLPSFPEKRDQEQRDAIILAFASQQYFAAPLRATGAKPLLWTTHLMAPEAYVLSAAIEGWLRKETDEQIRLRAANAYHQYQNCGLQGAKRLFATGW